MVGLQDDLSGLIDNLGKRSVSSRAPTDLQPVPVENLRRSLMSRAISSDGEEEEESERQDLSKQDASPSGVREL